jgi:hypothetical protein
MARLSCAEYSAQQRRFRLSYFNHLCSVSFPEGAIVPDEASFSLTIEEKALILHYLSQASGEPEIAFPVITMSTCQPQHDHQI